MNSVSISSDNPVVSVVMITYKQEPFIKEAIEGVLMQEVDFPIELIIADDCSPDNTSEIVQHYIDTHPKGHWIKYTRHRQNKGMMPNFVWALKQAKGEYIALCEGDDYWTAPNKLQFQFEFLSKNPKFSSCFHKSIIISNSEKSNSVFPYWENTIVDFNDVIEEWIIPTASLFFKTSSLELKILDLGKIISGDRLLHLLCANKGPIQLFDNVMSVYRINESSVTINNSNYHGLKGLKVYLSLLKIISNQLSEKNQIICRNYIAKSSLYIVKQEKKFLSKWKILHLRTNVSLNLKGKIIFLLSWRN